MVGLQLPCEKRNAPYCRWLQESCKAAGVVLPPLARLAGSQS